MTITLTRTPTRPLRADTPAPAPVKPPRRPRRPPPRRIAMLDRMGYYEPRPPGTPRPPARVRR